MCLEESFCPFTKDALNFQQPKIYAAPSSSVQVSPLPQASAVIIAPCDAPFNIPLYHSVQLLLMLTGKAESAQITRRQEMSM